ncbi:MAG: DUF3299 domain-containing protein [Bacteroidota bacterium]|nr:DUF3299 domain-containing protein [Bacteroidota bacterium]MDX5447902.1 DUF3299 domain-containing protein [Bacteroidota bacterium]MDX5506156.1 DUF3299 domain-containing protein [Bacteroidota bacterium]
MDKALTFFFLMSTSVLFGQVKLDWRKLSEVTLKEAYQRNDEIWRLSPTFPESLKSLDGKKVRITGYIIPLDVEGVHFALSAFPFSSCFFCGGAGPETVISIEFADRPREYKVDEVVTLEGILHLGLRKGQDFIYYLEKTQEAS